MNIEMNIRYNMSFFYWKKEAMDQNLTMMNQKSLPLLLQHP
jgi:hypothetical protein